MKNILVAVDLNPSDALLLKQVSALAEKFNAKTWILHVASPDPDFVGFELGPKYIRDFRADELRADHRKLQSYADELEQKGLTVESLLIQGPTEDIIKAEIQKLAIDLLILGSHRHGFLFETFIGHTSGKMIGEIHIPMLIVPLGAEE